MIESGRIVQWPRAVVETIEHLALWSSSRSNNSNDCFTFDAFDAEVEKITAEHEQQHKDPRQRHEVRRVARRTGPAAHRTHCRRLELWMYLWPLGCIQRDLSYTIILIKAANVIFQA